MAGKKQLWQKTLKWVAGGLGLLLAGVLGVVLVIWTFPGLLFVNPLMKIYHGQLAKFGVQSDGLKIHARSESFFKKSLRFEAAKICLRLTDQRENCVEKLELATRLEFTAFALEKIVVPRLFMQAPNLAWDIKAAEAKPEVAAESESTFDLQAWLDRLELGDVGVEVGTFNLRKAGKPFVHAQAFLSNAAFFGTTGKLNYSGEKSAQAQWNFKGPRLVSVMDLLALEDANLRAEMKPQKLQFQIRGQRHAKLEYQDAQQRLVFPFELKIAERVVEIRSPRIRYQTKSFRAPIFLDKFFTHVEWRSKKLSDLKLVNAEGSLGLETKNLLTDHSKLAAVPPRLDMQLKLQLNSDPGKSLRGFFEAEGGGQLQKILDVGLYTKYLIDLNEKEQAGSADWKGRINVHNFKAFAAILNGAGLMVPAPIHILNGKVLVDLHGNFDIATQKVAAQVSLGTDLQSEVQFLDLGAQGNLEYLPCRKPGENAKLLVNLQTTRVRIKLPDIDYKNPPALVQDARFVKGGKKVLAKGMCEFGYDMKFHSRPDAPLELIGPVLKNALPIHFSVNLKNGEDPEGFLRIQNFNTELFRRKTQISRVQMDLKTKIVEGRASLEYTDYKIFMNLSGRLDKIRMDLESDPPLPREDLYAILLFGRPLNGLDEDESGSAANMNAAAKDGALTMASLYLFASTPIESVGYNPHTQGLSAKVRLASGTSLNVGANEDRMTDVGITRRLAPQWRLRSTIQDPTEKEDRSASALLEWFKRF